MRTRLARGSFLAVLVAVLVIGLASAAYAEGLDYGGTYVGVVTTSSGRQVPIIVYARSEGGQAVLTLGAEGYTVKVTDPETWEGEQMLLSPTVPAIYSSILRGDGNVTLVQDGDKWTATGSGAGTALDKYEGSAEGSVERISADMDPDAAIAWHLANPVEGSAPPAEQRAQLVQTVEGVTAVAASPMLAPLADVEQTEALSVIGLWAAILLILASVFYGPKIPVGELDALFYMDLVEHIDPPRPEGGGRS